MMYSDLIKYLLPVVAMFSVVPLVFLILYKKLYKEKTIQWFLVYLILKLTCDIFSDSLASQGLNSLGVENWSVFACTSALIMMFSFILKDLKNKLIVLYWICLILYLIDNTCTNWWNSGQGIQALTIGYTFYSFVIILLCCLVFYRLVTNSTINLFNYPVFYICSGLILIHSSSVFLSILYNVSFRWGNNDEIILYIPYIFEILSSVIISFGFYKYRK